MCDSQHRRIDLFCAVGQTKHRGINIYQMMFFVTLLPILSFYHFGHRREPTSIPVVIRLEGTSGVDTDVLGLLLGESGQDGSQLAEVKSGNLLIELLGESVHAHIVVFLPERDLSQGLVGEAVGHDEGRMAGSATQVDQTTLGEQNDGVAIREGEFVHLRLDLLTLDAGPVLEFLDLNFGVKVADVADDGVVPHLGHVLGGDDVCVTGGGNIDLGSGEGALDGVHLIASHASLKGADGINLGDDDTSTLAAERFGGSFADVTVTADHSDLAGKHHIGGTHDGINQRVTATVDVVELGLGHAVINVEGREKKLAFLHLENN